jgi:hypothetical protein
MLVEASGPPRAYSLSSLLNPIRFRVGIRKDTTTHFSFLLQIADSPHPKRLTSFAERHAICIHSTVATVVRSV